MEMWKSGKHPPDSHISTAPTTTTATQYKFELSAIHRPVLAFSGTVQRSLGSRCSLPSVSRPAGLP